MIYKFTKKNLQDAMVEFLVNHNYIGDHLKGPELLQFTLNHEYDSDANEYFYSLQVEKED